MNRLRVYNSTSGDEGKDGRETAVVIIEIEPSLQFCVCAQTEEKRINNTQLNKEFLLSSLSSSNNQQGCFYIKLQAHPLYSSLL